jgi:hypothetical protein
MKSGSHDDDIELTVRRVPLVEISDNASRLRERGNVFRKQACEIGTALDCDELKTLPGQRDRELSRTCANLEHPVRRPQPREGDKVGDQRLGISGARARIQISDFVERFCSGNGGLNTLGRWHCFLPCRLTPRPQTVLLLEANNAGKSRMSSKTLPPTRFRLSAGVTLPA